ncbi:MAG: NAD(P)/FAD-dependent oxidoreductase [Phycisphaerae bacterium]|nr:NAD(P)/FAD-dependent oxidoreductase [Phycisphaerae bacterium]
MIETDLCIIGAGPAGMMAAIAAAERSGKIIILESNTTAGRKLLLTGRGRCNLTHTGSADEIIKAFKPFDRFVRHCIHEFSPADLIKFFAHRGLETVEEPDGCVFPKTQRSSDIKQILTEELKKPDIRILYGKKVQSVRKDGDIFVILSEKFEISAKSLIIAAGGASWPQTGSTGDGYRFAESLGHNIIKPLAALVPLITAEKFCSALAGVGVQNVFISCKINGKKISSSGPMIFTHNGIGGPAVLDLSRFITDRLGEKRSVDPVRDKASKMPDGCQRRPVSNGVELSIDLLPDITHKQLDKKLTEDLMQYPKRNIASTIAQYTPKALAEIICSNYKFTDIIAGQFTKKDRMTLIETLKNFKLTAVSADLLEKATVTRGGIDTLQIDRKTMQSKLCGRLFFAGEVINIDGPCGGYNLQFAFSSGFLAGKSAVESLK